MYFIEEYFSTSANSLVFAAAILPVCAGFASGETIASNLQADFRCGQVFSTWAEPPAWLPLIVSWSPRPRAIN